MTPTSMAPYLDLEPLVLVARAGDEVLELPDEVLEAALPVPVMEERVVDTVPVADLPVDVLLPLELVEVEAALEVEESAKTPPLPDVEEDAADEEDLSASETAELLTVLPLQFPLATMLLKLPVKSPYVYSVPQP